MYRFRSIRTPELVDYSDRLLDESHDDGVTASWEFIPGAPAVRIGPWASLVRRL